MNGTIEFEIKACCKYLKPILDDLKVWIFMRYRIFHIYL